jgi:O-acetyl-ADP-ribose deacetylase (regulator of RNase III)
MIKQVSGDILLTSARAIAHGVAPNDDFKSGLALSLRERWPAMYKDFRHYCHTRAPRPGGLWSWAGADGQRLISLLTQAAPPHAGGHPVPASLENVNHCLRALHKEILDEGIESVAITRLATGVGGLDWKDVEPLIANHLGSLQIPIYVYTGYHPGQRAAE